VHLPEARASVRKGDYPPQYQPQYQPLFPEVNIAGATCLNVWTPDPNAVGLPSWCGCTAWLEPAWLSSVVQ
jgi:hypothetical protein